MFLSTSVTKSVVLESFISNEFVIISLEEYQRLKEIEEEAHQLWEEKIQHILKCGGAKNER